ncbi:MAG: arginase family protein [Vicinamibacterales bacterium]
MANVRLVTPFELDAAAPALERLAAPGGWINRATVEGSTRIARLVPINRALADAVRATGARGDRPVSIAGDCCAVIGAIGGLQRAGLAPRLLWFDAHGDFNTTETSPSGFLGGMPLAMLVGRGDQTLMAGVGVVPLDEADCIVCDGRDLDPLERLALMGSQVRLARTLGDVRVMRFDDRPLHVHFDVDVLGLDDAPAVAFPVPGGPSLAALEQCAACLASSGAIASVSMTTWAFERDTDGRTAAACLRALAAFVS